MIRRRRPADSADAPDHLFDGAFGLFQLAERDQAEHSIVIDVRVGLAGVESGHHGQRVLVRGGGVQIFEMLQRVLCRHAPGHRQDEHQETEDGRGGHPAHGAYFFLKSTPRRTVPSTVTNTVSW